MKIGILGTGAYGLALASILDENNHDVVMWTKFKEEKDELMLNKFTPKLPGFIVSDRITITTNLKKCIQGKDIIVIAIPTAFVSGVTKDLKKYLKKDQFICIASKGIEQNTCKFLYDIVKDETKSKNIGVISGPSFAVDVVKKVPIGLSLGYENTETVKVFKKAFENDHFKLRETEDIIGVELCGSIKNIIAISAGIIDGMSLPISTKALLITESLNDVKLLIKQLNGNERTIMSFAGFGDILLTCTSPKSRNYSFGQLIGKGATKTQISNYIKTTTVEGVYTLKSIYTLIENKNISMPFIDLMYNIVFNGKDSKELLNFLIKK